MSLFYFIFKTAKNFNRLLLYSFFLFLFLELKKDDDNINIDIYTPIGRNEEVNKLIFKAYSVQNYLNLQFFN